jgi:hypothetical protein
MHRKLIRGFSEAALVFILSLALLSAANAQDTAALGCPFGQGYWKNTATWPVNQLVIGGQTYTQAELLIMFNTPPAGDASLILAHQLTAAKLNLLNGSEATLANDLIIQSDTLLATYPNKLPFAVNPSSAQGQLMVNLASVLESYNNGQLTLNCTPVATLTPTSTPTGTLTVTPTSTPIVPVPATTPEPGSDDLPITIVIEGPVQSINVNIITIYNINIQLTPNDPNLTIIRVGDILRVAGNTQSLNGTIIIIAVNVVIVNVDINVDTGEAWHDSGNCDNPPPPWAPAHGWHRRCDDIIIIINGDDESSGSGGMGMGMGN